jgi:hypothetical protein
MRRCGDAAFGKPGGDVRGYSPGLAIPRGVEEQHVGNPVRAATMDQSYRPPE